MTVTNKVLTTGIGSLPFDDADVAVAHVFAHYSLPFLPQLPKRLAVGNMASMFMEALTPEMLGALREKDARAFAAALYHATKSTDKAEHAVAHWPGATPAFKKAAAGVNHVKLQLIGPASFVALAEMQLGAGTVAGGIVCDWLRALQRTAIPRLVPHSPAVTWIWDDAILALPKAAALRTTWTAGAKAPANVSEGYHCCAPVPFATLAAALPTGILAIDLNVIEVVADDLRAYAQRGGKIIGGVVDTRLSRIDAAQVFKRASEQPREAILAFSGGCGTGMHAPEVEKNLAKVLGSLV